MYKVSIGYAESDENFETEMPLIPRIGENIGFWFNNEWVIAEITSIIYEFDETGKYLLVEINV